MELIWLGLSCGPIGLGDAIGRERLPLINRCIMRDGAIIKPDAPARPLDRHFHLNPWVPGGRQGVMLAASSRIALSGPGRVMDNTYRIHYLLGIGMRAKGRRTELSFSLREADAMPDRAYALLHFESMYSEVVAGSAELCFRTGRQRFRYLIAAPVMDGIAFFGDASKHVSAGKLLIHKILHSPGTLVVQGTLAGNTPPRWAFHATRRVWEARLNGKNLPCQWHGQTLVLEPKAAMEGAYSLTIRYEEDK